MFHKASLTGNAPPIGGKIDREKLVGKVTYEDVIELEKLKNDLYIDDVKVERIREQRRKKQKIYMEEVKDSSDRYSELRHMKVGVNYSIKHSPFRLADKATMKAANICDWVLKKQEPSSLSIAS